MSSWTAFAFLIIAAITYFFIGKLVVWIAVIVLVIRGWLYLSFRFPIVFYFINSAIGALLGGGRRR